MTITNRKTLLPLLHELSETYVNNGLQPCVAALHLTILDKKVKFPLLEFAANHLYIVISDKDHIPFCDLIFDKKTIGGNVIIGVFLQNKLAQDFNIAIENATKYIAQSDAWWVGDIIGERVWGIALLNQTNAMIEVLFNLQLHPSVWVQRSIGAGIHLATKWKLKAEYVKILFEILLQMSTTKDKLVKQGVGWAAKTIAKFHPEIIYNYENLISNKQLPQWFISKINYGLKINKEFNL